jgi:hypothetical protein
MTQDFKKNSSKSAELYTQSERQSSVVTSEVALGAFTSKNKSRCSFFLTLKTRKALLTFNSAHQSVFNGSVSFRTISQSTADECLSVWARQ